MKIKFKLLLLVLLSFFVFKLPAYASTFDNMYLRLDHQSANASVDALVCAQPSSAGAGTENKVVVTFPDNFSISSNTLSWNTDTSSLPQGATVWPGISSNAIAASGKSVTFTSSDLTANILYCFKVTSLTSNNGFVTGEEIGTLTTENSSNTLIDSTTYATSILESNQVAVTAWIGPQISNLPVSLTSDHSENVSQGTEIEYTINYGLSTVDSFPVTIQAQWSQGSVQDSPVPSIDILDYVVGSADLAYNSTPPIIDTVNRTITWTISSLPGGTTGQTVSFRLKTNDNYSGANKVNVDISAREISGSVVTPDSTVTQHYLYSQPVSTETPTPTPTVIPTITPEQALIFSNIDIVSLSQSNAAISVSTNNNALLTFRYGTSPSQLNNTIKTLNQTTTNLIGLDKLAPGTDYYFRVTATDKNGKSVNSDIFTFKTAAISPIPSVNNRSVIATSRDSMLINPLGPQNSNLRSNIIVVPTSSIFTIQFSLDKPISLKTIRALVRNKRVLGFNTVEKAEAATSYVDLTEIQPGVYAGKLDSPKPGQYEIYVKLIDLNGNILEQKIADLLVTNRFKVLEKGTNKPIENARVLLSIYNQTTKIYSVISPEVLPIENPTFTNPDGSLDTVLPYGKYKAEISSIGYSSQTIEFEISPYINSYPTIRLEKQMFSFFTTINYYGEIVNDALLASQTYLRDHANSSRLFNLVTTGALFIFVLITIVAFTARTHVSLLYLPYFLAFKLKILIRKEDPLLLVGKVEDKKTGLPVSKAVVYLQNPKTGHVEVTLKTNKLGEFYFEKKKDHHYEIYVMKKGYVTPAPVLPKNKQPSIIDINKLEEEENPLLDMVVIGIEEVLGMFLEFLIVLGFIFELYFVATFGFLRTAPFMVISSITFILLLTYVYKPRTLK